MTTWVREAFERGTKTFNAHDLECLCQCLVTPSSSRRLAYAPRGKAACVEFFGNWFSAFPDARVEVSGVHIVGEVAVSSREPHGDA